MKKTGIILFASIMLFSCTGITKITSRPSTADSQLVPGELVYFLPQTTIKADFTLVRKTFVPGPYAAYAKRFLNIENTGRKDSTAWKIDNISLQPFITPDPDAVFVLGASVNPLQQENIFKLTSSGFISLPFSTPDMNVSQLNVNDESFNDSPFTDLGIKRNEQMKQDTVYKIIFRDSAFVRTPVLKDQLHIISPEEKAENAANFILKTRKRRFKLAAGQYDVFPEGIALDRAIQELNETEQRYLELFIGKWFTDTIHFSKLIDPEKNPSDTEMILFNFSATKGITDSKSGDKITLKLSPLGITRNIPEIQISAYDKGIFYRIPESADLMIRSSKENLYSTRVNIYQWGKVSTLNLLK